MIIMCDTYRREILIRRTGNFAIQNFEMRHSEVGAYLRKYGMYKNKVSTNIKKV